MKKLIIYINEKWDNLPEPQWSIVMVILVIVVVIGVTSKTPMVRSISIPILMILCLIRLWGIGLTKKN